MIPHAILVLCILLVAGLTASSMAVRSASRIWLRHWAERRLHGAESVQLYLERPQRLLAAANVTTALTLGLAGLWIGWHSRADQNVAVLGLAAYAAVVVFVAQLIPRAIARRWPSAFIPLGMPLLRTANILAAPLLSIGRRVARVSDDVLSGADAPHEMMQDLLREGELEGVGDTDEMAIISGVMEFGEKTVHDVMTPMQDIFAIAEGLDARSIAVQIAETAFSRVPVYRASLDQIIGMYHAFDVLKEGADQVPPLRPVAYAPADTHCNELLFRMLRARLHLAVVHDDRGHTLGIATLENLLEELVGDIRDEHDEPATSQPSVVTTPAKP
jgi:putative hemolysin